MKLTVLIIALGLAVVRVQAQDCMTCQDHMPQLQIYDGRGTPYVEYYATPCTTVSCPVPETTPLDKAKAICDKHRIASGQIILTIPPSDVLAWAPDWSASCAKVQVKWEDSEAGKAAKAAAEQEARDHALVDSVANGGAK